MIGWWRARLGWLHCIVNLLTAGIAAALWPIGLIVPNLVSPGTNSMSIGYVLAFLPGLTWITVVEARRFPPETAGTRQRLITVLDCCIALGLPVATGLVLIQLGLPTLQGVGRDFILASALCSIAIRLLPIRFAFLLPVGYLVVATTAGFPTEDIVPEPWALAFARWDPERDWAVLGTAVLAAVIVRSLPQRTQPDG